MRWHNRTPATEASGTWWECGAWGFSQVQQYSLLKACTNQEATSGKGTVREQTAYYWVLVYSLHLYSALSLVVSLQRDWMGRFIKLVLCWAHTWQFATDDHQTFEITQICELLFSHIALLTISLHFIYSWSFWEDCGWKCQSIVWIEGKKKRF